MESISTLSQAFSNLPGSSSIFLVEAEFTARALLLPRLHRQVYAQALAQSISENVEWHSMAQLSDQSTAALSCQQFCDYVEAFHLRLRNWEITRFTTPVATSFATNFLELFQFAISEAKTIRQASLEPATSVELELGFGAKKGSALQRQKKSASWTDLGTQTNPRHGQTYYIYIYMKPTKCQHPTVNFHVSIFFVCVD